MKFKLFSFLCLLFASKVSTAQNNKLSAKTATTITLKTPANATGQAVGTKVGTITISLDTTIKVNPKYAYLSIDFANIIGTSQNEILDGTNTVWVFDKAGKEVIIKEKFLKKVSAAMGENICNMLTKIAFKLKTDKNIYNIRYKWESKDKRKNIEILTSM
jgi:hypothetical protein